MLSQQQAVIGLAESHQHLKKADELARVVSNKKDLYEDREAWAFHQELTTVYRNLLVNDLEFALDRKVEQSLWNVCFKNYISHLQTKVRDKRFRGDAQLLLSWFLEFSSGFYTTFLTEIQQKFNLEIPFLKSGDPYGLWRDDKKSQQSASPESPGVNNINYLCQHCLVHLGDIARYRGQMKQAETFYRAAISLAPGSGQPYNQIAILEASRANKLSAVYFYVRAICLKFPFPAASTNLAKMLSKLTTCDTDKLGGKVSQTTFIAMFLKMHGLLHHSEKLRHAVRLANVLTESLTSLIVSEGLSTWQLLQIIVTNMWAYHQVTGEAGAGPGGSKEERLVSGVVSSVQAALLSSCLLRVYTLQKEELMDYYALPAIRLLLEWIRCNPDVLTEKGFTTRPQIWPGLARLLNEIRPLIADFNKTKFKDYPLPEDYDMQAFIPLHSMLARYNMKQVARGSTQATEVLCQLRCARLMDIGHSMSSNGQYRVLSYTQHTDMFEAVDVEWRIVKDDPDSLVEEIEMLEDIESSEEDDSPVPVWVETGDKGQDPSRSILKTKASDTTPSPVVDSPSPSLTPAANKAKPRLFQRNVALAAIMAESPEEANKETYNLLAATDSKKVMFKTPSPCNSQSSGTVDSNSQLTASQDDIPVTLLPNPPLPRTQQRRSWSPLPAGASLSCPPPPGVPPPPPAIIPAPVTQSKICVDELDFSVPPPSLHSNVRPPSLFSSGPAVPGGHGLALSRNLVSDIQTMRPGDIKDMLPPPEAPGSMLPSFSGLSLGGDRDWPTPSHSSSPAGSFSGGKLPGPGALTPGQGGPNPLLSLISAVERPSTLPPPGAGAQGAGMFSQPYSLFSPSSWPGPLLSSPSSTASPIFQQTPGQSSTSSLNPAPSSMFGSGVGGPSPLERLLHQAKHDK